MHITPNTTNIFFFFLYLCICIIGWRLHYNYQYWKQKNWIPISSKSAYVDFELMPLEKMSPSLDSAPFPDILTKMLYLHIWQEWVSENLEKPLFYNYHPGSNNYKVVALIVNFDRESSGIHKHSCMSLCQTESIYHCVLFCYMHYKRKSQHLLFYNQ